MSDNKYINSLISKTSDYQRLKNKIKEDLKKIQKKEEKLDNLQKSYEFESKALEKKQEELDILESNLKKNLETKEDELEKRDFELSQKEKKYKSNLAAFNKKNQNFSDLKARLSEANKKNLIHDSENARLHSEINARDDKIRRLLKSTSWKITAPLRGFAPFFKSNFINSFFLYRIFHRIKLNRKIDSFIKDSRNSEQSVVELYNLLNNKNP